MWYSVLLLIGVPTRFDNVPTRADNVTTRADNITARAKLIFKLGCLREQTLRSLSVILILGPHAISKSSRQLDISSYSTRLLYIMLFSP